MEFNKKFNKKSLTKSTSSSSIISSSTTSTSTSSSSSSKSVHKLYTKIRHKIEDSMPPKIQAKLNKTNTTTTMKAAPSTNQNSMSSSIQQQYNVSTTNNNIVTAGPVLPVVMVAPPRRHAIAKKKSQQQLVASQNSNNNQQKVLTKTNSLGALPKTRPPIIEQSSNTIITNLSPAYDNIRVSIISNGFLDDDSDEECRIGLNTSNISLEDEIFEELEKVAHDEAKLNAVLKNFDQILMDFNSGTEAIVKKPLTNSTELTIMSANYTDKNHENSIKDIKSEVPAIASSTGTVTGTGTGCHKLLQKSKTCSIIESRCILKKTISEPSKHEKSTTNNLDQSKSVTSKSLWNLKDFENTTTKSTNQNIVRKFDKNDCKLPVFRTNSSTYNKLGAKSVTNLAITQKKILKVNPLNRNTTTDTIKSKNHLSKAKSVLELSSNSKNFHPICTRTSSAGSKIPVMRREFLSMSGRSNSFCDQIYNSGSQPSLYHNQSTKFNQTAVISVATSISAATKPPIQIGRVLPNQIQKQRQSLGNISGSVTNFKGSQSSVNRIVKNINEISSNQQYKSMPQHNNKFFTKASSTLSSSTINLSTSSNKIMNNNNSHSHNKRRLLTPATSTPHSLHKIGISSSLPASAATTTSALVSPPIQTSATVKVNISPTLSTFKNCEPSTTLSSATVTASSASLSSRSPVSSSSSPIKLANNEQFLNNLRSTTVKHPTIGNTLKSNNSNHKNTKSPCSLKRQQSNDLQLNKCLEKGQEILRKVEAFGGNSTKKLDNKVELNFQKNENEDQHHYDDSNLEIQSNLNDVQKSNSTSNHNSRSLDCLLLLPAPTTVVGVVDIEKLEPENVSTQNKNNSKNVILNKSPSSALLLPASYQNEYEIKPITTETISDDEKQNEKRIINVLLPSNNSTNQNSIDYCKPSNINNLIETTSSKDAAFNENPDLLYAIESSIKYPHLESCKIIPPILGESQQHLIDLMVNVKSVSSSSSYSCLAVTSDLPKSLSGVKPATPSPLPRSKILNSSSNTTAALLPPLLQNHIDTFNENINNTNNNHINCLIHTTNSTTATELLIKTDKSDKTDKDYHSDSDDSGHISNENEDIQLNLTTYDEDDDEIHNNNNHLITDIPNSTSNHNHNHKNNNKISELLEKFESPLTNKCNETLNCNSLITSNKSKILCKSLKVTEVQPVKCIQSSLEIYPTYCKEVLFRSGVLSQLEAKRDELLSDRIIQLQSYCRGYLARRRVAQRRVQELAVRCIQRNVRAFLAVRDWPWWRLLVRVTPLLNVHRTEEQLKLANDELQNLRLKLEKIENDRNSLKTDNDKLENKLSEMTVDLAEERSSSNIASERLEAETAERLKLEKELHDQQNKVKNLQETSEKLEMELICAKSDLNGISEDEDGENDDTTGGVYKLKYERVARELEFTKRRLQTQHEHDLEQLVGLKKQLEKKLADAYEEVEEQRQVVGQWKRKAQKMTNEQNDLRMLLEEQNGRNNLLEKKQRKFDLECQALQDAARQERQAKDRLSREKDVLIAEKFTLEQNLADTRLELDLKEEKVTALQRELEEMTFGGGTEEEIAQLRRSKMDMDRRLKEQEEELDEMAGQVQLLEQAKLRLEMTLETMRKEARRETAQRDEELEEARGSAYKKLRAIECQLEAEHEERTLLLREKHELERRLQSSEEQDRADRQAEEAANQKFRRDLRKYKALLKDAHAQLERLKADSPGKALIRQLRNQLEDAEAARTIAMKSRQTAEAELSEMQALLDEAQRSKNEAEDKSTAAQRDRAELQAQIEENEEEMSELMKKYSTTVKQLNNEQSAMSEYEIRISELESERNSLKEHIAELQARLENVENMSDPTAAVQSKRLELRAKELESRLELEQATKARLEIQANRHKDSLDKVQQEVAQSKMREMTAQDALKKSQKSLRELREEFHTISSREQEGLSRRKELEKKLEMVEAETASLRNDLRLALQRIADLQQAMEEGDDDVTESDSDTTDGSISDLEERLKPIQVKRTSINSNGIGDTKLVLREKSENSPRITLTSPSTATALGDNFKNGDTSFA